MKSQWKLWCDAKNEKNAGNILSRVQKALPVDVSDKKIEPYQKGGFEVSFSIQHSVKSWNDFVVETITLGQCLGYGWRLTGDITERADGWCNESNLPGIESIQWSCDEEEC
ncbi:MAG: hypothetical protein GKR91_19375 [Pseudomonadales bacterium]|nr:hypothetical protein [Pseudomonadales bacterium]